MEKTATPSTSCSYTSALEPKSRDLPHGVLVSSCAGYDNTNPRKEIFCSCFAFATMSATDAWIIPWHCSADYMSAISMPRAKSGAERHANVPHTRLRAPDRQLEHSVPA